METGSGEHPGKVKILPLQRRTQRRGAVSSFYSASLVPGPSPCGLNSLGFGFNGTKVKGIFVQAVNLLLKRRMLGEHGLLHVLMSRRGGVCWGGWSEEVELGVPVLSLRSMSVCGHRQVQRSSSRVPPPPFRLFPSLSWWSWALLPPPRPPGGGRGGFLRKTTETNRAGEAGSLGSAPDQPRHHCRKLTRRGAQVMAEKFCFCPASSACTSHGVLGRSCSRDGGGSWN